MSVQAGIWNTAGEPVNREVLARISQSLAEYGPDDKITYFDGPLGMLYRPFHTTLESRGERQPHLSAGGKVITWDGRLDNRDELAPQLCNDLTDDRSDVAIVAAAFDRWGAKCFAGLIGDWALAIWDPCLEELILARDYIGIRQLFYYPKPKRIMWCNHLVPLALCGDQFTLCEEYIAGYLAVVPDAHLTPYREIHSVPPGKFVRLRGGKTSIQTYWSFNPQLRTRYKTDAEYEEQYRDLFRQAVRRRLRTDSPILADLSGGLDSSSIVCMADDILAKEGALTPSVDTFSFYDSNEPDDDDLRYFTKVEQKRGRTGFHSDLRTSGHSLSFEYSAFGARPGLRTRPEVAAALSGVFRQHEYRVVLSGTGGDDVNGQGLDPCLQMTDLLLRVRVAQLAKQLTAWSLFYRKRPWLHLFFQTLVHLTPVSIRRRLTEQGRIEPWVNHTFAKRQMLSTRRIAIAKGAWLSRPSVRDASNAIVGLSRLMSSVEPSVIEKRYPYLDQNLVEFLKSIPLDQLLRPGQRRHLMRRALADILPSEILTRKTKAIANRCYFLALEKHWDKVKAVLDSPLSSRLGYVDGDCLREIMFAMKNGRSPDVGQLLKAFSLELWLRNAEARGVISIPSSASRATGTKLVE